MEFPSLVTVHYKKGTRSDKKGKKVRRSECRKIVEERPK